MILAQIIAAGLVLLAIAAIWQTWTRRNQKRPLARHAVNAGKQPGPPLGMEATDIRIIQNALIRNARLADQHNGQWPWLAGRPFGPSEVTGGPTPAKRQGNQHD